jgi:hypothetical protein
MRLRFAVLAAAIATLGVTVMAGVSTAAPRHNHHLTINATPNPVIAGDAVLIYGQLNGPDSANQVIYLYHHLDGSGESFTLIGTTRTNSMGFYEFTREDDVVYTNRRWFVRGPGNAHSRTIQELVEPLVSMTASTDSTDTNHPIVFTGSVTPNHRFDRVFLQDQTGSGDDWHTLTSTQLQGDSSYSLAFRWRRPGIHDVRVLVRRDARNIAGASDPVAVNIQQAQAPDFTINTSDPIAPWSSSVTITGVLDQPGTTSPEPQAAVQLWGRSAGARFTVLGNAKTGADGSYQFTEQGLTQNTIYQVRTLRARHVRARRTSLLFQGVQDIVTLQASPSSAYVGQSATFSGTVMPDKAGHVVYLQEQGKDGDWHTIAKQVVRSDSTFEFTWQGGSPGTFSFRARITHDRDNVGTHSPTVSVTETLPSVTSLPPGP